MSGTSKRVVQAVAIAILLVAFGGSVQAASRATRLFRGLNAPGLSAAQNKHVGSPPDTTGAIGRSAYLESVNVRQGLFDTSSLRPLGSVDDYAFWDQPVGRARIVDRRSPGMTAPAAGMRPPTSTTHRPEMCCSSLGRRRPIETCEMAGAR